MVCLRHKATLPVVTLLALGLAAESAATGTEWGLGTLAAPMPTQGRVVSIADGDTLTVLDPVNHQDIIRLASVDAPELGHGAGEPGQPYSRRAKDALASMVFGRRVALHCYERDKYGRAVCDVLFNGRSAGRDLVATGLAWANRARPEYLRDASIPRLEQQAREKRLGLWSSGHVQIEPWVWRKNCWRLHDCALPAAK